MELDVYPFLEQIDNYSIRLQSRHLPAQNEQ